MRKEDFELIVSDNSSTDHTKDVVLSFSDPRIRYVKTEEKLSMDKSWEFALSHAKGEYVTFLGDDDAYSVIYLESFYNVISKNDVSMISCVMAEYYYREGSENSKPSQPELFSSKFFTNKLFVYEAKEIIKSIFTNLGLSMEGEAKSVRIPQLINTVYRKDVFSKIKAMFGKVFPNVLSGDYYLAVICMSLIDKYYFIDSPLSFHGISPQSTTSSISNRKKGENLKETQPELAKFYIVPINLFVPYNFSVDAVMLAKASLGNALEYIHLDLYNYFINMLSHFHAEELEGHCVANERQQFNKYLLTQNSDMQRRVNAFTTNRKRKFKDKVRLIFFGFSLYQKLRNIRNKINSKKLTIEAVDDKFLDIVGCGKFINKSFLEQYETTNH